MLAQILQYMILTERLTSGLFGELRTGEQTEGEGESSCCDAVTRGTGRGGC